MAHSNIISNIYILHDKYLKLVIMGKRGIIVSLKNSFEELLKVSDNKKIKSKIKKVIKRLSYFISIAHVEEYLDDGFIEDLEEIESLIDNNTIGDVELSDYKGVRIHCYDKNSINEYIKVFIRVYRLLEHFGYKKLWYGDIYISNKKKTFDGKLGKYRLTSQYNYVKDVIVIFTKPRDTEWYLLHELGHRWYRKFMTPTERSVFNDQKFNVTEYSLEGPKEDFAEMFANCLMNGGEDCIIFNNLAKGRKV